MKTNKGFTLIELLVVIAIIAVLSVVVILSLNPAETLRQSRDSNRISDMASLKSALALYLADVSSPSLGSNANCYVSAPTGSTLPASPAGTSCGGRFTSGATVQQVAATSLRKSDGTGWIPVNFANISSGSPLSNLPVDPTNTVTAVTSTSYFYAFRPGPAGCTTTACTQYEANTHMESTKFQNGGGSDVESTDGGNEPGYLEVGTSQSLSL